MNKIKKLYLLPFLLFCSVLANGQEFYKDSLINKFIKDLKRKQTDTILIYKEGVVGSSNWTYIKDDTCFNDNNERFYSFWRKNGKDYFTEIYHYGCFEYDTLEVNFTEGWNQFFKNKAKIKKEEMLMPQYIEKRDTFTVGLDHYSYKEIYLFHKNEAFNYEINDFYFSRFIRNAANLNFQFNSKTIRKKFQVYIERIIKQIEETKSLKKKSIYKAVVE